MAIEIPLTKEGPVRIQAKVSGYAFDFEITEVEARDLAGKLNILLAYRKAKPLTWRAEVSRIKEHPRALRNKP